MLALNRMKHAPDQRVVVLMGGASRERDISLKSGRAVAEALQGEGWDVVALDLPEDTRLWQQQIAQAHADVAFVALHGTYGEDGCIQGLLEILKLPYTGSAVAASALCMHKSMTKHMLNAVGIKTPANVMLQNGEPSAYPVFIKPVAEGSSVGLHDVPDAQAWKKLGLQIELDDGWLVESCVQGVEIAISVLGGKALPAVEVAPKSGVYDFTAKYSPGATDYYCPARLDEKTLQQCMEIAERAVFVLGCAGAPRVDLIVPKQGEPVVLEVNTIPGMTATSLLPKAAAQSGIAFADLCKMIVAHAMLGGR